MKNLNFSELKKLEIILEGEHQEFATGLLDRAGVKGYTIFNNLSGKGSGGFDEGHLMFNEDDVLIMIMTAGTTTTTSMTMIVDMAACTPRCIRPRTWRRRSSAIRPAP